MSTIELRDEYKRDEDAAKKKFENAVVELTGEVELVGCDIYECSFVVLKTDENDSGIKCVTAEKQPWVKVTPSQTVRLKGRWPELCFGPALIDCVLIETEEPTRTVSSEELAEQLVADPEAMDKKYNDQYEMVKGELVCMESDQKYLIVEGEVVKKEKVPGETTLVLRGVDEMPVKCTFPSALTTQTDQLEAIQAGQHVAVFGKIYVDEEEISLSACLLTREQ